MDTTDVKKECNNCTHKYLPAYQEPCQGCSQLLGGTGSQNNWKPDVDTQTQLQRQFFDGTEKRLDPKPVVAVPDAAGGAVKADTGKPRMELLARSALEAEAAVMGFGAQKYAAHNWRKGMNWSRLGGAAMRHLMAWLDGEDVDPETGLSHLAHLRCCAAFLIEYQQKGLGHDDRHTAA